MINIYCFLKSTISHPKNLNLVYKDFSLICLELNFFYMRFFLALFSFFAFFPVCVCVCLVVVVVVGRGWGGRGISLCIKYC